MNSSDLKTGNAFSCKDGKNNFLLIIKSIDKYHIYYQLTHLKPKGSKRGFTEETYEALTTIESFKGNLVKFNGIFAEKAQLKNLISDGI